MESPAWMFTKALSHRQKVCRLFKRAMREIDGYFGTDLLEARFHKVVLRARFDAYRDEKDPRKADLLYLDGCRQVWLRKHWTTFRFGTDVGGASYDRDTHNAPDVSLDYPNYTDVEREQFPYYFNRREQRKKELLEHWSKIEKEWDEELAKIQTELPKSPEKVAEKFQQSQETMENNTPPKLAPKPGKVTVYQAICDYVARQNGELSFKEGDLLYVSDASSDTEWWPAKCYGESGLVHRRYIVSAEHMQFPVHDAAKRGNIEFLQECINNSVSVNGLDKSASTPLYWASHCGHADAVRLLTSVPGICVSAQNRIGDTALHAAAWKGHIECVRVLLERGASTAIRNSERKRPIDVCNNPEAKSLIHLAMLNVARDDGFPGDYDSESEAEGQ